MINSNFYTQGHIEGWEDREDIEGLNSDGGRKGYTAFGAVGTFVQFEGKFRLASNVEKEIKQREAVAS